MEIRINREIRNYTEAVYFGLTLRQFVCSLLSAAAAVALWLALRPFAGTETLSWICILGASPFAAAGFVTYHGMTAEKLLWTVLRTQVLTPGNLPGSTVDLYYELLSRQIAGRGREERRKHEESAKRSAAA